MNRFPKIKSPCPKEWDELTGDAKTRFCSECQYQVHNLSESTPAEVARILSQPGRKCIAYFADSQAAIASGRLGKFLASFRFLRPLAAVATLVVALMSGGCATRKDTCSTVVYDKNGKPENVTQKKGRMLLGYTAY